MPVAKRKTVEETEHFTLLEDKTRGKVLRRVVRCNKCNKEKSFHGPIRTVRHKCCNWEYYWSADAPPPEEAPKDEPAKSEPAKEKAAEKKGE